MKQIHIIKMGSTVGLLSVAFFFLCVSWGFVLTDPSLKELHINIIQIIYPGFAFTGLGMVIGIVEAFIYGWVFGVLFAWLCRKTCALG